MQPTKDDKKINPLYPIAWCIFLVLPVFILYNGLKRHNFLAVVAAFIAICGFSALIVIAVRHNRKISKGRNTK
ncbi:MAG: hypothetical protein EPN37_17350 [Chitinophagaceae bacterium]|nr:MAG: hypothetical protein EPN37_17350 [Chitinophagaceae bacterium]